MPDITTERLRLRELSATDLDFVAEMLSDVRVMRYYPRPLSRDEAMAWIQRQIMRYERDGHGLWLAATREGGEPVGQVGLVMQPIREVMIPEIGYLLHPRFWGLGYATEAACAVRDWAFGERGYDRVVSLIRPENAPSQAVARRVGMSVWHDVTYNGVAHHVFTIARELA